MVRGTTRNTLEVFSMVISKHHLVIIISVVLIHEVLTRYQDSANKNYF